MSTLHIQIALSPFGGFDLFHITPPFSVPALIQLGSAIGSTLWNALHQGSVLAQWSCE
jgi:hypothetical protein